MKKLAIILMTTFCFSIAFPILDQGPQNEFFGGGGGGGDKCARFTTMVKQC